MAIFHQLKGQEIFTGLGGLGVGLIARLENVAVDTLRVGAARA
jgi:hypothetical protein